MSSQGSWILSPERLEAEDAMDSWARDLAREAAVVTEAKKAAAGPPTPSQPLLDKQINGSSLSEPLTPAEQWAALPECRKVEFTVTDELVSEAKLAFRRVHGTYLFQFLTAALPRDLTASSARKAIRSGHVEVDGSLVTEDNMATPPLGATVMIIIASVDKVPQNLSKRLKKFNGMSRRPEAHIRICFQDLDAGWAVVNKPVGMHSNPNPTSYGSDALTFQDYMPALLPPPSFGMHCRSPKVCHRLDFRVSGPMVVATSREAERALANAFEEREIHKEYRAIVCGAVGEPGDTLVVVAPVDGQVAETRVEVLQVVPCVYFGKLSELRLWPITGRRQQLRRHCAIELGAAIVNEEQPLFQSSAPAWEKRNGGAALPAWKKRLSGRLFLAAVEVSVPRLTRSPEGMSVGGGTNPNVTVREEPPALFPELLDNSAKVFAWAQEHAVEKAVVQ